MRRERDHGGRLDLEACEDPADLRNVPEAEDEARLEPRQPLGQAPEISFAMSDHRPRLPALDG